jgi:hypothetical protein
MLAAQKTAGAREVVFADAVSEGDEGGLDEKTDPLVVLAGQLQGLWGPKPANPERPAVEAPLRCLGPRASSSAGAGKSSASSPHVGQPPDLNALVQLEILRRLQSQGGDDLFESTSVGQTGAAGIAKTLKSLHCLRRMVQDRPRPVIKEFVGRTKEMLGVSEGQAWTMTDLNKRISWGRHKGLQRTHFMLSEIFTLLDNGKLHAAQALTVQCMKATHQAQLDDGSWHTAWHLTMLRNPLERQRFGGTERELEVIASYAKALEDLDSRMKRSRAHGHEEVDAAENDDGSSSAQPKGGGSSSSGRGRGRGRGGGGRGRGSSAADDKEQ